MSVKENSDRLDELRDAFLEIGGNLDTLYEENDIAGMSDFDLIELLENEIDELLDAQKEAEQAERDKTREWEQSRGVEF